jgi:hypothetical protein
LVRASELPKKHYHPPKVGVIRSIPAQTKDWQESHDNSAVVSE